MDKNPISRTLVRSKQSHTGKKVQSVNIFSLFMPGIRPFSRTNVREIGFLSIFGSV